MAKQHNPQLDWLEDEEEVVRPVKVKPIKRTTDWEKEEMKKQRKQRQKSKWEQWE